MRNGRRNKMFWEEPIACFLWNDKDRTENDASNNSAVVAFVFVAAVTFMPDRCLTTTEGYTYRHRLRERFMTCAVEIGSGATFHKYWFRHSKWWWGHTQKAWRSHKPTFIGSRIEISANQLTSTTGIIHRHRSCQKHSNCTNIPKSQTHKLIGVI
jgi:hypothetical protein